MRQELVTNILVQQNHFQIYCHGYMTRQLISFITQRKSQVYDHIRGEYSEHVDRTCKLMQHNC